MTADRLTTRALRELDAGVSLLSQLRLMCGRNLVVAVNRGVTADEVLAADPPPWLPIDAGAGPRRHLDAIVRTGHAETSHAASVYRLRKGVLTVREAYRLTRKGREAAAELLRLSEREGPQVLAQTLEILFSVLDPPAAERDALRRHYGVGGGDAG